MTVHKLPQSKPDSRVLRETIALSNVTITSNISDSGVEDSSSIQNLIGKMNSGLWVGTLVLVVPFSSFFSFSRITAQSSTTIVNQNPI